MRKQDFIIGNEVEVLPEDGHNFYGTIVGTKDEKDGSFLVTVKDQEDDHFDVNPEFIKF